MPTIEFYGFGDGERNAMELRLRARLQQETFREDCVFVAATPSQVRDWSGRDRPFVRISTRSQERAARFIALLADLCDLEIVYIDFRPKREQQ